MLGPALGLSAYAVFSGMDLISKLLDGAYPAHMLIVLNGIVALIVFMIWARKTEGEWLPKPLFMGRVAANGALSGIGLLLAFYGYRTMPTIADAYAIAFSGPLIAVVLAFLVLKETVSLRRWAAVAIGFAGVMLILQPDIANLNQAAIAPLSAAFCFASASILLRSMKDETRPQAILIYTHITLLLVMVPFAIFMELSGLSQEPSALSPVTLSQGGLITLAAIAYAIGQVLLVTALAKADASVISPMAFTQMFWGVFYGLVIWGSLPRATTVVGVIIIMTATIYIVRHSKPSTVPPTPVPL